MRTGRALTARRRRAGARAPQPSANAQHTLEGGRDGHRHREVVQRRRAHPSDAGAQPVSPQRTPSGRLSALDGSFLRLESPAAHMHVGWSAVFAVPDGGARPTLAALRERVAERLDGVAWCRWRLEPAPLGLAEPRWIED